MILSLLMAALAAAPASTTTMAVSAYVMPITASAVAAVPSPQRRQALLFEAARLGRTDLISALIEAGEDVNVRDARGDTPLMIATRNAQSDAARVLIAAGAARCAAMHSRPDPTPPAAPADGNAGQASLPSNATCMQARGGAG